MNSQNKVINKVLLGIIGSVVFVLGSYVGVQAYSGTIFGRSLSYGYFKGNYRLKQTGSGDTGLDVLPTYNGVSGHVPHCDGTSDNHPDGNAIPACVDTPDEFVRFLKAANVSGSEQRVTGSAFIVYSLMGRDGAFYDKIISSADWTTFEFYLTAASVSWNQSKQSTVTSYYEPNTSSANWQNDVYFWDHSGTNQSIVIKNVSGVVVYSISRPCGNTSGSGNIDISGLVQEATPVTGWKLSTNTQIRTKPSGGSWTSPWKNAIDYTSSNPIIIQSGDQFQWNHIAKNIGDGPISALNYYYQKDYGDWGTGSFTANNVGAGNEVSSVGDIFTAGSGEFATAGTYCRKTYTNKTTSADNTPVISYSACVRFSTTVPTGSWSLSPTAKVNVRSAATGGLSGNQDNATVNVGDTVYWSHIVTNNGSGAYSGVASPYYYSTDYDNVSYGLASYVLSGLSAYGGETSTSSSGLVAGTDLPAGGTYCRWTTTSVTSPTNANGTSSGKSCVTVSSDVVNPPSTAWSLSTETQVSVKKAGSDSWSAWQTGKSLTNPVKVEVGDYYKFNHIVRNTGTQTVSDAFTYRFREKSGGVDSPGDMFIANVSASTVAGGGYVSGGNDYYSVTAESTPGNVYCHATVASKTSSTNSNPTTSLDWGCIQIDAPVVPVADWTIAPSISVVVTKPNGTVTYGGTSTTSYIAPTIDIKVNDKVKWVSTVKNNGTTAMTNYLTYTYVNGGFKYGATNTTDGIGGYNYSILGASESKSFESRLDPDDNEFIALAADAGESFCRKTSASPAAYNNVAGTASSQYACVRVVSDWKVEPTIKLMVNGSTASTVIEGESTKTVNVKVNDVVKWEQSIKNTGSDATTSQLTYYYKNDPAGVGDPSPKVVPIGFGASAVDSTISKAFNNTESKVTAGDAGKTYCRQTFINRPRSSVLPNNDAWTGFSCIKVLYNWQISGTTSVSVNGTVKNDDLVNVQVGDVVKWNHQITNIDGDDKTKTSKIIEFGYSGYGSTAKLGNLAAGTDPKGKSSLVQSFFNPDPATFYEVQPANVGKYCRNTYATPISGESPDVAGPGYFQEKCIELKSEYELKPTITIEPDKEVDPGASLIIKPVIENTGPTISNAANWKLTQIIYSPLNTAAETDPNNDSASEPCAYYGGTPTDCNQDYSANNAAFNIGYSNVTGVVASGVGPDIELPFDIPLSADLGTKYCFALSVNTPTQSGTPAWSHSELKCAKVVKKPKVQIWGGDLRTGGMVQTSQTVRLGNMFGSWAEYGILAKSDILLAGSGSALADPGLLATYPVSAYSKLSFNNTGNSIAPCTSVDKIGCYATSRTIPNVLDGFKVNMGNVASLVAPSSLATGVYRAGDLTLNASVLTAGKSIVIISDGTVKILGNQTYDEIGTYNGISQIPQLVIIADNISIEQDVERVDAWLIAKNGTINTCSSIAVGVNLSSGDCNKKLKINGPVIAKQLYLRRTFGAEPDTPGTPAEIINLRADAYLWAYAQASQDTRMQTVYTTELPPRF